MSANLKKPPVEPAPVQRAADLSPPVLDGLLDRLGLRGARVAGGEAIPGSYWGEVEAGLKGDALYYRDDTPVHSVLHEACHYACMSPERRGRVDTDAGGDDLEECAVCYLQIVLASVVPEVGAPRMLADMDAWGYSFRLGSARRWFEEDAEHARGWLERHGLIDAARMPTWRLREDGRAGDT